MADNTADLNQLFMGSPQTMLEHTLIAEYLFSQGYLMSDVKELPAWAAERLLREACRFTALRLTEIESGNPFPWIVRLPISMN